MSSRERALVFSFNPFRRDDSVRVCLVRFYCRTRSSWRYLSERDRLLPSFRHFLAFCFHPTPCESQTRFPIGLRIFPWFALSCSECFSQSKEFDKAASDQGSFYYTSHSIGAHQIAHSVVVPCIPCLLYSCRVR